MIISSAPGSMMLLGEHAVLHGNPALVAALAERMTVQINLRSDDVIHITSTLGELTTNLNDIVISSPFQFVLQTIQYCRHVIRSGFDLGISSSFSHEVGMGSSAAVTTALLAALYRAFNRPFSPDDLIRHGHDIVKLVQGHGSGADIAASVLGGVVYYVAPPYCYERLSITFPITLLYCGFKTKTAEVIKTVQKKFQNDKKNFDEICNAIGQCVKDGIVAIKQENWQALGEAIDAQQKLMQALGVSLPILDDMVSYLKKQKDILAAKISGSGLGDCVFGLGKALATDLTMAHYPAVRIIPVNMSLQGVCCEEA